MPDLKDSDRDEKVLAIPMKWEECGMIGAHRMVPDIALTSSIDLAIPENMAIAHRAVLYDLWEVLGMGGTGGKTARCLVERLTAHFEREEELIGSIFALAGPDGPGMEPVPEEDDIAVMSAFLELELRDLKNEHDEFRPDIQSLAELAETSFDQGLYDLALRLDAHLSTEEQIHFPAAGYIGSSLIKRTNGAGRA